MFPVHGLEIEHRGPLKVIGLGIEIDNFLTLFKIQLPEIYRHKSEVKRLAFKS